ncbi:MAG: GAF domain-containing protein, partial [Gemmatimonadales bacterium]|nr:GAF domain-containing protein [Gemmatimonadales bacterium]
GRWWALAAGGLVLASAIVAAVAGWRRRVNGADARCTETAAQLDRRISELFSLQELGYILSGSLELDRIVDQVARFAARFLQADGAVVVLSDDGGRTLRVAAAVGSLEEVAGRTIGPDEDPDSIIRTAIADGRIKVAQASGQPAPLLGSISVPSAAIAPLRSHGDRIGALAVAGRQGGPFTTEDLWLLSTVATNASVVLANGRLFQMLQRSTEQWETAFNALTEGIAVVGPEGTVLRANSSLARMAGTAEPTLVGQNFASALFGVSDAAAGIITAARHGERPAPMQVRSDSAHRTFRLTAAPLGDLAGNGSVVALVEDVTEQREMEAQLIHNEKMATIGQLVSGVAHELNNPLTSIAGLTELLLETVPLADAPRDHLRVIHDQAERAGRIVRNLLTFARKGTPDKTPVDINDVVVRTTLLIAYEMKLRGIELDSRLSTEPLIVIGDRYELQQVLLNLVTNAVQAVGSLPEGRPRVIGIETRPAGDHVILRVSDSGTGVTPDLVPYLFTPFFTTKAPGQGTGLGLSLSYGLVESHDGRLSYAAAAIGGAEFTITLPAVGNDGADVRRVLVVDSDPAVHRTISALLGCEKCVVEGVRTADHALTLAHERNYDLVIADDGAVTGSGAPFSEALLQARPDWAGRLAVIAGGRGDGGARRFRQISRPFNLREIRTLADEVLNSRPRSPAATAGS